MKPSDDFFSLRSLNFTKDVKLADEMLYHLSLSYFFLNFQMNFYPGSTLPQSADCSPLMLHSLAVINKKNTTAHLIPLDKIKGKGLPCPWTYR